MTIKISKMEVFLIHVRFCGFLFLSLQCLISRIFDSRGPPPVFISLCKWDVRILKYVNTHSKADETRQLNRTVPRF